MKFSKILSILGLSTIIAVGATNSGTTRELTIQDSFQCTVSPQCDEFDKDCPEVGRTFTIIRAKQEEGKTERLGAIVWQPENGTAVSVATQMNLTGLGTAMIMNIDANDVQKWTIFLKGSREISLFETVLIPGGSLTQGYSGTCEATQ